MNLKKKLKNKIIGLIKRGNWFNNILFPGCRKFWNYNTFNTDVINLGSTSAMNAFSYEGLQIKGANFAIGANPLLGDFEILKNYHYCPVKILDLEINRVDHHPLGR